MYSHNLFLANFYNKHPTQDILSDKISTTCNIFLFY